MFINRDNIEVTLPPDVPGTYHILQTYERRSKIDRRTDPACSPEEKRCLILIWILHPASLSVWVIIGLCFIADNLNIKYENKFCTIPYL